MLYRTNVSLTKAILIPMNISNSPSDTFSIADKSMINYCLLKDVDYEEIIKEIPIENGNTENKDYLQDWKEKQTIKNENKKGKTIKVNDKKQQTDDKSKRKRGRPRKQNINETIPLALSSPSPKSSPDIKREHISLLESQPISMRDFSNSYLFTDSSKLHPFGEDETNSFIPSSPDVSSICHPIIRMRSMNLHQTQHQLTESLLDFEEEEHQDNETEDIQFNEDVEEEEEYDYTDVFDDNLSSYSSSDTYYDDEYVDSEIEIEQQNEEREIIKYEEESTSPLQEAWQKNLYF